MVQTPRIGSIDVKHIDEIYRDARDLDSDWFERWGHMTQIRTYRLDGKYDVWEWFGELNVPIWESGDRNRSLGGSLAFRRSDYSSSGEQAGR